MEKEMISSFVENRQLRSVVKTIFHVIIASLILFSVYAIIELFAWWQLLHRVASSTLKKYFYDYRLRPAIAVVLLVMSLLAHILSVRAYQLFNKGLVENDQGLIAGGFKKLLVISILGLIELIVSLISISYRLFL